MDWEQLLADLEGEFDARQAAELSAEVEDRTRRETARLRLVDRLRAAAGQQVSIAVTQLGVLRGVLVDVGPDWLLLTEGTARHALVPLAAVLAVGGISHRAAEPGTEGAVVARLGLGYALRAIARDRAPVTVTLLDGGSRTGTIDGVGADHLALAEHAADEARRARAVRGVVVVPFSALLAVRSR